MNGMIISRTTTEPCPGGASRVLSLARRTETEAGHTCQEVSSASVVGKQCSRQETLLGFLVLCIKAGILDSQSCRCGFPFCLPVSLSLSLTCFSFILSDFFSWFLAFYLLLAGPHCPKDQAIITL